jgi:AcrR family transcriptional regulator
MPRLENAPDTKKRLLDAAEQLFALRGAAATSLRAITNAAGTNPAAVHYHYGSKDELLLAVAQRRADPVNRERLKRLDDLEASAAGDALGVEEILDAFLRPEVLGTDLPFSAIVHHEPRESVAAIVPEVFGEVHRRFVAALGLALPDLGAQELDVRFHFVIGLMLHVLRGFTEMPVPGTDPGAGSAPRLDSESVLHALIEFLAAGLDAPSSLQVST